MEYDQIMSARLSVVEARLASTEERLAALERGTIAKPKRKKDLSPEDRQKIRERLVRGQEAARARREAEAKAAKNKKKEANRGASTAEN